jgi:hypothetical protein
MEDPVSGEKYNESIGGMKQWATNEVPYGLPFVYAILGFTAITGMATVGLMLTPVLFSWAAPVWSPILILVLGVVWAFGGWQHGVREENEGDFATDSGTTESRV